MRYQTASPHTFTHTHTHTHTTPAASSLWIRKAFHVLCFSTCVLWIRRRCRRSAVHIKTSARSDLASVKKSSAGSTIEPIVFPLDRWSSALHVGLVCAPVKALMHYKGLTQITDRHDNAWQVVLLKGGPRVPKGRLAIHGIHVWYPDGQKKGLLLL